MTGHKLIEWQDDLSVGIDEIDSQHKTLVDIVNELHQAVAERRGKEVMQEILDRLDEYTRIHFATEESLMRIFHYPAYETHKETHDQLIDQLRHIRKDFEEGHGGVTFELMQVLKNWLVKHIQHSDKEYTPYFMQGKLSSNEAPKSWFERLWPWGARKESRETTE
ncbi:MAG: bacteriohemerythrin [Halothiobacillaceae bacterium]|nr:bacteriohemerythrin [Halothiobacillaceae bacterium]MDY0049215.1 bacteriohemerythrin [Halothiobacillaceae bacterium]